MHWTEPPARNQAVSRDTTRTDPAHVPQPPAHLAFLDGLRGLAALFVVVHHASYELPRHELEHPLVVATNFLFLNGHNAVALFIVLSGFSLMLPVVRSADGRLRGGTWDYLKRRARRILPAYYAALLLFLAMIAFIPILRDRTGVRWDTALPVFDTKVILSHIFLVHNFDLGRAYRIDPPMWSVATEWQIYFLFPVFLALWRRYGISMTVAAGFLTGYLVYYASMSLAEVMIPWYTGLFAIGMAVAVFTDPSYRRSEHWGDRNLGFFLDRHRPPGHSSLRSAMAGADPPSEARRGSVDRLLRTTCLPGSTQFRPPEDAPTARVGPGGQNWGRSRTAFTWSISPSCHSCTAYFGSGDSGRT